jgi:hypothetical protein
MKGTKMKYSICLVAPVTFACSSGAIGQAIPIDVWFAADQQEILLGQQFSLEIRAEIAEPSAIVGWGMDALFDDEMLTYTPLSDVFIGDEFTQGITNDGDGLAGLVFPPAEPVWGTDVHLATITMTAIGLGDCDIFGGITIDDPLEGFVLPGGDLLDVRFFGTTVSIIQQAGVPAAGALPMAIAGLVTLASGPPSRRRR